MLPARSSRPSKSRSASRKSGPRPWLHVPRWTISSETPSAVSRRAGTAPACQAALSVISATRGDPSIGASEYDAAGAARVDGTPFQRSLDLERFQLDRRQTSLAPIAVPSELVD